MEDKRVIHPDAHNMTARGVANLPLSSDITVSLWGSLQNWNYMSQRQVLINHKQKAASNLRFSSSCCLPHPAFPLPASAVSQPSPAEPLLWPGCSSGLVLLPPVPAGSPPHHIICSLFLGPLLEITGTSKPNLLLVLFLGYKIMSY